MIRTKWDTARFIIEAQKTYGSKYNYNKTIYVKLEEKLIITCPIHGDFWRKPIDFIYSNMACKNCALSDKINRFLEQSNLIHQNKYDYSLIEYKDCKVKIKIICPLHGVFEQTPDKHIQGKGCKLCGNLRSGNKQRKPLGAFISECQSVHGDFYDYSLTKYTTNKAKIKVICPLHGEFTIIAIEHKNGARCHKCACASSVVENDWLDSLNIPDQYRQTVLIIKGKKFKVDAYDPDSHTVYEFYGDFWHGNPKIYDSNEINKTTKETFGELYFKTMKREKTLIKNGYNVISIWENDWLKINNKDRYGRLKKK